MSDPDLEELTATAVKAALDAGSLIGSHQGGKIEVQHKSGGHTYASQVVTEVDRKAQDMILNHLHCSCDQYDLALLTEESEDDRSRFEKEFLRVSVSF